MTIQPLGPTPQEPADTSFKCLADAEAMPLFSSRIKEWEAYWQDYFSRKDKELR